jgi:hypothetical protein
MTNRIELTRRSALASLAAVGGLAAVTAPAGAFALPERAGDRDLADSALRLFSSPRDVRRVGAACHGDMAVCQSPAQTRAGLIDAIFGGERDRLAASGDAEVHGWLRGRVREDFAAGRTVTVEGWVLAETEARVYALAAHA